MRILNLEFKNFASYGNTVQKLKFEKDHNDLILLSGLNGAGKSSISKAIIYALYGRVDNENLLPGTIGINA